jgi:hypothetical protein
MLPYAQAVAGVGRIGGPEQERRGVEDAAGLVDKERREVVAAVRGDLERARTSGWWRAGTGSGRTWGRRSW